MDNLPLVKSFSGKAGFESQRVGFLQNQIQSNMLVDVLLVALF